MYGKGIGHWTRETDLPALFSTNPICVEDSCPMRRSLSNKDSKHFIHDAATDAPYSLPVNIMNATCTLKIEFEGASRDAFSWSMMHYQLKNLAEACSNSYSFDGERWCSGGAVRLGRMKRIVAILYHVGTRDELEDGWWLLEGSR